MSDTRTADRLLAILRNAQNPISGPEIGRKLGVSRAAVWKHLRVLETHGYKFSRRNPDGYSLEEVPDRLLPIEIGEHLSARRLGCLIHHFDEIDSTNRYAMGLARAGAREGEVVVAEGQAHGRGRLGRTFFSPSGVSLYASVILRPAIPLSQTPQITLVAGLSLARTIERYAGIQPGLKWPNDIQLNGKKVAGILTEMESEADRVLHVVCGPGVNLNIADDSFPLELREIATSILAATGRRVPRAAFAAEFLNAFESDYDRFLGGGFGVLREEWEHYSILTGRRVNIDGTGEQASGTVIGIDDDGSLRVRTRRGELSRVISGDVTLATQKRNP